MIKFENVYIKYVVDFYSLYDFNIEIDNHTLFIGDEYLGANAILRLLAKIDKKYTGNIYIDQTNIKKIKDRDLDIAYVSKEPTFLPTKNLFQNLYFPLKIRKISKIEAKNIINDVFLRYNLKNYLNFNQDIIKINVRKIDKSMQKIITLIRAIIRKPKYILLENLFDNLDEKYYDLVFDILSDVSKYSIIIASEKNINNIYKKLNFNIINLAKKEED